jgi:formyl-CoA transferase
MAAEADVVIESYATGVAERLGIGAEALCAANPRLVHCSISGFGRTGPLARGLGYDVILQAFSGIMAMTGERGGGPIRSPFSPIDQSTGMNAFSGILAALLERGRTGKGCRLEVSLFETAAALLGYSLQIHWEKGTLPEKSGSGHESLCPYQAFDAADGPVLIGIASDNLWRRFAAGIGRPELTEDPRFRTNADRVKNAEESEAPIAAFILERTLEEGLAAFEAAEITAAPVYDVDQFMADPHVRAREIVVEAPDDEMDTVPMHNVVPRLSDTPGRLRRPAPIIGEHTAELLAGLGCDKAEIESLADAGVVEIARRKSALDPS